MSHPLTILTVSGAAQGGGAERIAWTLHRGFAARGQDCWMAVGRRNIDDPSVLQIPAKTEYGLCARLAGALTVSIEPFVGRLRGAGRIQQLLRILQEPRRFVDWYRGREHFDYPGTSDIIELPPRRPDIIHCHNLHGRYFDLRKLENISRAIPTVLTLHDEWAFTGHCAYTMGCERWVSGCGHCPGLHIYPPVRRDATAENWQSKRAIYARSKFYISAPSHWLMERARRSILFEGAIEGRVIYNGVDVALFKPGKRAEARQALKLPLTSLIMLFTANAARRNMFKDYETVREAAFKVAAALGERDVLLIALGDNAPAERRGKAELRFIPYERDPMKVAAYYQAADLYLHAAKADNLPTTIIEALSCGVPVVATAVGGIPEQVQSLASAPGAWAGRSVSSQRATGVLVPQRDSESMAAASAHILANAGLRRTLSANARADALERFDLTRQVDETLAWFHRILESRRGLTPMTFARS